MGGHLQGAAAEHLGLVLVLALLVGMFGALSENFLSALTFTTLANQIPALTVVAVGMTLVLVIGGIDLSVGSVLALSGGILGVALTSWGLPLWLGALLALGVGLLAGIVNGWVTVAWAVPSFIVTLGMLEIARGSAYLVTASQSLYVGEPVQPLGAPTALGLSPTWFLAILLVAAGQVTLSRTIFGRYMIAIGTNEQAVRLSGIDPRPVKMIVFALVGVLAGLGGVFSVAYLETADPNAGIGIELAAIAAVVIGGTSLMGGRGSVVNSFLGVLIISVLQVGLAQIGASEPVKRVVTGAVIVLAVILDSYRHRFAPRGEVWRRLRKTPG
ncbi:MAG: ABC transporter permease [Gemmatimonadetes bacterium]|nr:ABC transporter permease [Gemmatimonadota bacterium]